MVIPAQPKDALTNSISVLQSFALSPALCPSEHTQEIFINPPQNVARTFGGVPLPNSSKQIDQFFQYELVECSAGVKYLGNTPLSLSLLFSSSHGVIGKMSMLGRRSLFSRLN